jgi:moderate conductance mechanosensitive channel
MTSLTTPPECNAEDWLCDKVEDITGNAWLGSAADWLVAKPVVIVLVLLLTLVIRWIVFKAIARLVDRASLGVLPPLAQTRLGHEDLAGSATARIAAARRKQRAETLGGVLRSISSFTLFTIAGIMVLSEIGVDIGPLIAGAGIVGIALGFGAQTLVRDFLSGLFMLFEDQYGIGDVVDLGDASGTVEAVSLRVTRLRDVNGTVWYVRNGEVLRVGNMSQNWARTVLDVRVGLGEDLTRVRGILEETCHSVWEDEDFSGKIIEEPEVWGVERMDPDAVVMRVAVKTAPLEQWDVARELRKRIKERFGHEGIEIPFPQQVVWNRSEPQATPESADA